jgi:hypothetical protein
MVPIDFCLKPKVPIDFCLKPETAITWLPLNGNSIPMALSISTHHSASFDTPPDLPWPRPDPLLDQFYVSSTPPAPGQKGYFRLSQVQMDMIFQQCESIFIRGEKNPGHSRTFMFDPKKVSKSSHRLLPGGPTYFRGPKWSTSRYRRAE